MPEINLKFKDSIPLPLEIALIRKHGFHVSKRDKTEHCVVFAKVPNPRNRRNVDPDLLDEVVQTDLLRQMNKIVDFYMNPELHTRPIRARLNNLAMCFPEGPKRQFIQNWTEENVVEDQ